MEDQQRAKIIKKIQNLLEKTVESGATEHEAYAALEKAKDLMSKYVLTHKDITEEELRENIVSKTIRLSSNSKVSHPLPQFSSFIARTFSVQSTWTSTFNDEMTLWGHKDDVQLASYFIEFCIRSMFNSMKVYRWSDAYKENPAHGRTKMSSYAKGFIAKISNRLKQLYSPQYAETGEPGLITFDQKMQIVLNYVDNELPDLSNAKDYSINDLASATQGFRDANDVSLVQGLRKNESAQKTNKLLN